jgi:excinuclease ABC subunit C
MPFNIESLKLFPEKPGVYIMKNRSGTVLYVGKANNLRQRVKQYFVQGGDGRESILFLVPKIHDIETIVVTSEKEALILENNLIKRYKPKYNVLLKDDKSYISLGINNKHKWPRVQVERSQGKPKGGMLHFGPYPSAMAARKTLDLLNRIFPLRQCSDQELARRTRPCILYGMKRCIAPCVGLCTKEEYDQYVQHTINFLKGQDKQVLKDLYKKMHSYSDALEFERANEVLQMIHFIEKTVEEQHVDKLFGIDTDAIGLLRQGDEVTISQLLFRGGKLLGSGTHHFEQIAQDDEELLSSFLLQHYEGKGELPHEILLPVTLGDAKEIEELLSENRPRKVQILSPKRGQKVDMISMANENAVAAFKRDKDAKGIRERMLSEMQDKLSLTNYPNRIECFDTSNISGSSLVASMIVFTAGEKDRSRYRKYKIKTVTGPDDYSSMYEALQRRYKRGKEEGDLPDLIIVDGGKGQLNIALKVLAELDIVTVDVIGLAKEQGRHDKGMSLEQVFRPNIKDPIMLKRNSSILFFLQNVRDEAHRVAITFHRQKREKQLIKSSLDDIEGIGPAKKKALLKHFGSIKKIKEASAEELMAVPRISQKDAEQILKSLAS